MPANMTSVRLQILEAMKAAFVAIEAGKPDDDPYGVAFSTVAIGPLSDADTRKRFALGIVVGDEDEQFSMPYITCLMTVNIEFKATVNKDDVEPGILIEQLLTVVKRRLTEDRTWGGLAIDTKITGSQIDLISYADRSANGVCMALVAYRHSHLDPRNPNPDF